MARLTVIEHPKSLLMKLAYWFSRRQVGKVITPLKALYVRLPFAFARWIGSIQGLEKKLPLSDELKVLLRIYVAQLNTCHFCIDIAQAEAIQRFTRQKRFLTVRDFENSSDYSDAERAALRFAHELTVNRNVTDATFRNARQHFTDPQMVAISWMVSSEHLYNLMNLAFEIESDGFCAMPDRTKKQIDLTS